MTTDDSETLLTAMGYVAFFRQQQSIEELENARPARVLSVQRSGLTLGTAHGEHEIALGGRWWVLPSEQRPTVGDWVLLDAARERVLRLLERKSLFKRMAPGDKADVQLIAANVDVAFIVSSCNAEFNVSRLERYLALATDAGAECVLVLTKTDLAADPEQYRSGARAVRHDLSIELVDARNAETLTGVHAWCAPGQTIALIGSSGVGKSTLLNTLAGEARQVTRAVSVLGARGSHTTTHRSLHALPGGAWLLDSPGMRELSLVDVDGGLSTVFADVDALASGCRFSDCAHEREPGCAVQAALDRGELDPRRLANYRKLLREDARASQTLAEQRHRARAFAKRVRRITAEKSRRRD
jgi:ribosome biogenesis GTPase / thiamine phosphate phosphatase